MIKTISMVLMALFTLSLMAGDPAAGKAFWATCTACHGPNGEGMKAMNSPAIAGQETWYLERQLKNFKTRVRGGNPKDVFGMQMQPMSMTLPTDKAIADVSAYANSLKPIKPKSELGGNAATGKALYMVCATCHGQDGKGMKAQNSPNLTIQQDWYIYRQLKNFKEGIRGTNPKDVHGMAMRPMAMTLANDQAMKDVVAYIMTLVK